ncbi:MAG TPA: NAD(P)-binding domain-containing protein [Candidatus Baltobacteraceae bacterium]|nr:NAD(P)-binding domain-containing protein [Candidatus Baltobacteraceae bacterium]
MSGLGMVGVVGVGRMGANIARRLQDVGYEVAAVFDRDRQLARNIAGELESKAPSTLAEVTALADTILTVVSDDAAMEAIYADVGDSLLVGADGKLFINCATVTPSVHVTIETLAAERGAASLEACMASSITQARAGTLYLIAGGKPEVFERARPLLRRLSSEMRYVGPAGSAAQVKALVNMVMNSNTAALAEGLGLGEALGLDLTMLREVFAQTGASSRVLETDGSDMQARMHEVFFSAAHAAKDTGIALVLADGVTLPLPVAAATKAQYERLLELGLGDLDKSAVSELTFHDRAPAPERAVAKAEVPVEEHPAEEHAAEQHAVEQSDAVTAETSVNGGTAKTQESVVTEEVTGDARSA